MDELLYVRTSREGSVGIVHLKGVLDLSTRDSLAFAVSAVVDVGVDTIRIDATELDFCDSTGINTLLGVKRSAIAENRRLAVVNLGPHLADLWKIVGVLDYLTDLENRGRGSVRPT